MLKSHVLKALEVFILFTLLACPAVCQMVYNVSVYNDVSTDGSTVFATSTTVDSSTGCGAHGSYSTTATLIAPDGTQAPNTFGGMVANTSMPINGRTTGDWVATGTVQLYCGCFMHWVGGGGLPIPFTFAVTFTASTGLMSDMNGWCAQRNNCTNGTPRCSVSSIKEGYDLVPCPVFFGTVVLMIFGTCDIGVSTPVPGPGICTL